MTESMDRGKYTSNKWNTTDLYKSDHDFLVELEELNKLIPKFKNYKGKILKSSNALYDFLIFDTNFSKRLEQLLIYGHINNDADTRDTHYQELYGQIVNLSSKYSEETSFVIPELLKSEYSIIEEYINEDNRLKTFERLLKSIYREKDHVLSEREENIISSMSKIFSMPDNIQSVLTDSDFTFDPILVNGEYKELTESNYQNYLKSSDRSVREQAFKSLFNTYKKFNNTLATILKSEVELNNINAKLRHHKSALSASLYGNEIDDSIYHNLIKSVRKNLGSLYKYFDFKKKYLGLSELHIYDTFVELNSEDTKDISYEEAKELVLNSLKPLGDTYIKDLTQAFDNTWIDSVNNKGKRGGAYCTSCYNVHPYVLLSYENTIKDVSTLAHELGHAMHYYYTCKNQEYQNYQYSIFVAEVASQVNEILLYRYLIDNTNDQNFKIKIMDYLLQNFKATIFRQTMFAEFELYIHEYASNDNILTFDVMNKKYYELNKEYFGDSVIVDDEIKYEWSRIPHFYYNFYVYQYATGYATAIKIANEIYNGNNELRDNYLKFLTLGNSMDPVSELKVCDIDMTQESVIDDAVKYMDELLNDIEV